jgi:Flp pilus assembly protein TadG
MFTVSTAKLAVPAPEPSVASPSKSLLSRFAREDGGNVAIIFGLTLTIVVSLVGGAVDYGRWLSARNQTQAAVDSALLAAGRTAQTTYGDASKAVASAQAYYAQMKSKIVVDDSIVFESINSATSFTAKGTAFVQTPFLAIVGVDKLPVMATSEGVIQSETTIAQGGNSGTSIEIGLMLDTTGSMSGQKLTDLKAAAKDLVDIVVWADQGTYTSKVAIAPFSDTVNVGQYFQAVTNQNPAEVSHQEQYQSGTNNVYSYPASCYKANGQLKGSCKDQPQYLVSSTPIYSWRTVVDSPAKPTCVVERSGTDEAKETVPSSGAWIPSWTDALMASPFNMSASQASGYQTCTESSAIVPLTSDKTKLKATIDGLVAENYTAGALGTAWAWYLISPEWGTIFTGSSKPEAYSKMSELGPNGVPKLQKIAILMTDGEYNTFQYCHTSSCNSVTTIGNKAKALCTAMKAKGIKVYTVGFDITGNTAAIGVLSNCATDSSHFYNAANGDALKAAFRDIALKISALRITH